MKTARNLLILLGIAGLLLTACGCADNSHLAGAEVLRELYPDADFAQTPRANIWIVRLPSGEIRYVQFSTSITGSISRDRLLIEAGG